MLLLLATDSMLLLVTLAQCQWNWCSNNLTFVIVSMVLETVGAVVAHRVRQYSDIFTRI